jgi:hypothetical protein
VSEESKTFTYRIPLTLLFTTCVRFSQSHYYRGDEDEADDDDDDNLLLLVTTT